MMKNIESIRDVLCQIMSILDAKQKRGTVIVFVCMVFSSVVELLGVSAIYPFLQMMLNMDTLERKGYTGWLYRLMPDIEAREVLLVLGIMIILVYLVKNIFLIFSVYVQYTYAAKFQCEVSTRMLKAYLKRPYQFFLNVNSGEIMRGIISDIEGVYQILLNFFTIFAELLTVIVLGIFLFITDWTLAVSAMLLMGFCFLTIILGFKSKIKAAGQNMWSVKALKNQYGYQAINGIKEITVLDRRENFIKQFYKAALVEQKASVINGIVSTSPDRILEGICIGGFMGIVCFKIAVGTELDSFIPVLGTFAMGAFRILPSIAKISSRINSTIFRLPSLRNVYENFREVEEYDKSIEKLSVYRVDEENVRFFKELEIKNINWKYQNSQNDVLHNASLLIHKGEAVAFIGSSGAGKTTLADIIMGLLKPQKGMVSMDGIDIFTIPHQWAKIIGYVPQSVFLIDDTIRNNVAFGLEEKEISDEKVWDALGQAQLKDFVQNLPNGLDTIVGERGIKFSGGQRQRIAIARALYENPDILVLDEATSALDNETEMAVMEQIKALRGSKTLIIVAHRLTTIKDCNKIYEVENGKIIERNKESVLKDIYKKTDEV